MYYQSRYHLSNGRLSLALDSLTGELLELVDETSGENLIKNHTFALPQPFAILAKKGEACLHPGSAETIARYPQLQPEIAVSPEGQSATVTYHALWDGERPWEVQVKYTVELTENGDSQWRIHVENHSTETLKEVRFPCVNGIYFGRDWQENALVYPFEAGIQVKDPVTNFGKGSSHIYWRWQNYKYVYGVGTISRKFPEDVYGIEERYSGNLSMKWLDYYGENTGLYFACHDPEPNICALRADTYGPHSPGMNFSFGHPVRMGAETCWDSPVFVVSVHSGDWHQGADKYRAFHRQFSPATTSCPKWFEKSAGLMAHYDFKYQNGGVVHHFSDITKLLEQAKEIGLNHLLVAGWHKDGFDNGFPEYVPADDLGTADELRDQVAQVIAQGGHICFYVNSRLANTKYTHLKDFIAENGVLQEDGSVMTEQYGSGDLRFSVQCIGSRGWRKKLEETVAYVTEDIGIDGMYLDQLSMGSPCVCYNTNHDHSFGQWNFWYQKLLEEVAKRRQQQNPQPLSMIHEGVSDSYGNLVSGQLVSTFSYHHCGAFPQLYRYTFPEQILVDMLYPERNLAMRPVHVAQASREMIDRAFLLGMYFWIYDLEEDNTFRRDPKSYEYLKKVIALRKFWLEEFGLGTYGDQNGLTNIPEGIQAACYTLEDGLLIVCSNTTSSQQTIQVQVEKPCSVQSFTAESLPNAFAATSQNPNHDGTISLELSSAPHTLFHLKY